MKGTIIKNLKLTKVIDGDTIKIMLDDKEESIRFACLDTEESQLSAPLFFAKAKMGSIRF